MGKCTFKGGVHPFDGKELSKDKPIKELFPEGDMVCPFHSILVHRQFRFSKRRLCACRPAYC